MKDNNINISYKPYTLQQIEQNYDDDTWTIPVYQRGYVWSEDDRAKLIDSIIKGFPLGTILLWQHKRGYKVLDGQQRTRSILRIRKNPFKDMRIETLYELFNNNNLITENPQVFKKIHKELSSKTLDELFFDRDDEDSTNKTLEILKKIESNSKMHGIDIKDIAKKLNKYINKLRNGELYKIDALIIENATETEAIEIFDRLNTQGKELTKFEKLAARWSTSKIKFKNEQARELIQKLYSNDSIGHSSKKEIRDIDQLHLTPSEILYTMVLTSIKDSKIYRDLFVVNDLLKTDHLDKWLWLFRVMYWMSDPTHKLDDTFEYDSELGKHIMDYFDEDVLTKYTNILSLAVKQIEKNIGFLHLRTSATDNNYLVRNFSQNMMITLLLQVFLSIVKNGEKSLNKKHWRQAHWSMIKDILENRWASSTNKSVKETIEQLEYLDIKDFQLSSLDIERIIEMKEKEEITRKTSQRGFHSLSKFVVALAYYQDTSIKTVSFDYDHIIPFSWLEATRKPYGKSSIGNCGLLEYDINRGEKKDDFNTEKYNYDKLIDYMDEKQLKKYKKLLEVIKKEKQNTKLEEMYKFRFDLIKNLFLKNISPE